MDHYTVSILICIIVILVNTKGQTFLLMNFIEITTVLLFKTIKVILTLLTSTFLVCIFIDFKRKYLFFRISFVKKIR